MDKFTPLEYIYIAIANKMGYDKWVWQDRIDWAKDLMSQSTEEVDHIVLKADEPILMAKSIRAFHDAINGIPTGFIMGLDGTASGLQLLSCLSGCAPTMEKCNVIDTGKRECAYQTLAIAISYATGEAYTRAQIKDPAMQFFYGGLSQAIALFGGKSTPEFQEYYRQLQKMFPGAFQLMNVIQSCWQSDKTEHMWTLPDGHVARPRVMVAVQKSIEVDELNHSTFTYQMDVNMPEESGLALAAHITHSCDAYVVREMYRLANKQGFELLAIHDEFWASPNYMQNVRENYAYILSEISKMDLIQSILREVTGEDVTYVKFNSDLSDEILKGNYALS